MADVKFSQFEQGNQLKIGDIVVGLRSGANYKFSFPDIGFKDENGNYLLQYAAGGSTAVNYTKIVNSETSLPPEITVDGTDDNISNKITPKGTGSLILDLLLWPKLDGTAGQAIVTDGALQLSFADVASVTPPVVDDSLARFDGTGGALQDSLIIVTDAGAMSGATQLDVDNLRLNGNAITSTDTAGDITITPDTTGDLVLDGLKWPQADGTAGQAIITDGAAQLSFADMASVTLPVVDMTIARFDGTGGNLEDSGVTISDTDVVDGITQLNVDNLRLDGNSLTSTDVAGDINLTPDTTGDLVLDGLKWPQADGSANTLLTTDGAGQLSFTTATFPGTAGSTGTILRSNGTNWVASTATFADTYAASTFLYSNGANTVEGLATANSAQIVTNSSGVPAWTASLTDGQVIIGATSGTPAPATLTPGTGISIASGTNSITISATGGGFAVATISGTTQNAAVNTKYIALNAGQTTLTLPSTYSVGDAIMLVGGTANTGGWVIQTAAGDTVTFLGTSTSAGGTITSTAQAGESIELVCDVADTSWIVEDFTSTLLTTA